MEFSFDDNREGEKEKWYLSFPKEYLLIQVPYTYETKLSKIGEEKFHSVVWYEKVPSNYLEKVKITPNIDEGNISIYGKINRKIDDSPLTLTCEIKLQDIIIQSMNVTVQNHYIEFTVNLKNEDDPWSIALWSPSNPILYDVSFALIDGYGNIDSIETYFGMRKISIQGDKVLLNNSPLYQRLILDQGYWEESHLTPPSDEAIIKDIDLILAAGYNGVRKHQKIEDRRFLYWCDKKGLLVWSEMAAAYTFNDEVMHNFTCEWMDIVEQFYNHPSIITWTIFNESWGIDQIYTSEKQQNFTRSMYYLTKSYDSMRPVIVNDGWEHTVSDIITLHDYEEIGSILYSRYEDKERILNNKIPFNGGKYAFAKEYQYKGQPIIISEYGGIAFNRESGWGYGNQVKNEEDFLERFKNITNAIKRLDYVVGYCYTQITDVQQEVNGLYNIKREPKVDITRVRLINEEVI